MSEFPLACFYHIYADGKWMQPLSGFVHALRNHGYTGPIRFSVVGSEANSWEVVETLPRGSDFTCHGPGNEYLTINMVRDHALVHDGAVLYAHTKGAYDNSEFRARWRRSMTVRLVAKWRENLVPLADNTADAVGCHWLSSDVYAQVRTPFFGGNFWMARCDYLRTLPECSGEHRDDAERWIGLGDPRVVDLLPGWPGDDRWPELAKQP